MSDNSEVNNNKQSVEIKANKSKFKVGVFAPFQIHKRTKCYIWIQWKGHANYPDTISKKKISQECCFSESVMFLGGVVSALHMSV